MITARYDPPLFPRERTPSPRLQPSRSLERRRKKQPDEFDRFMELAQAALDEATKEDDAKGVLQELMERLIARSGAPLMAGVIAEQLRSQEVIEQLAERSFDRRRLRCHGNQAPRQQLSSQSHHVQQKQLSLQSHLPAHRIQQPPKTSSSSLSPSNSSPVPSTRAPAAQEQHNDIDHQKHNDIVAHDQYTMLPQQLHTHHDDPDRLLLISEYMWRVFRLLLLASLVALMYHYVCTYPQVMLLI